MDSFSLSMRLKQPGEDVTYRASEQNFIVVAQTALDTGRYEVVKKPRDLARIFGPRSGLEPEAKVTSTETGRKFFVEVKKQAAGGNADERACRHHTVQFYKTMRSLFPDYTYHPYVTIFCETLAVRPRYTAKVPFFFEPDQYLFWANYDAELLTTYLRGRCAAWLDPQPETATTA